MSNSRWRWRIGIPVTLLVLVTAQLYSSYAATDAPCHCSAPCISDHEAVENIVTQLIAATATNVALKQQVLRLQHHTPCIAAPRGIVISWQLLSSVLLIAAAAAAYQVHWSRSHTAQLKQHIQQLQQKIEQQSNTLQHHYDQQKRQELLHADWSTILQDMIRLVRERAATLAEQEALLQQAVQLESCHKADFQVASQEKTAATPGQDATALADISCIAVGADVDSSPQSAAGFCGLQSGDQYNTPKLGTAGSGRSAAGVAALEVAEVRNQDKQQAKLQDNALVIQLSLQALHSYMRSSTQAKMTGLQQLECFVQQLQQEIAAKALKVQENQLLQLQRERKELLQQQKEKEDRLQDTPFAREKLEQAKREAEQQAKRSAGKSTQAKQQQTQGVNCFNSACNSGGQQENLLPGPVTPSNSSGKLLSARLKGKAVDHKGLAARFNRCFAVKPETHSSSDEERA